MSRTINFKIPGTEKRNIAIDLAVGQKAILLRKLNKEMDNSLASFSDEDEKEKKRVEWFQKIVLEFTNFENIEDLQDSITDVELIDIYFSIQGDTDSIKKLIALN